MSGYPLPSVCKSREGTAHSDRNAQFEHINQSAQRFLGAGQPVISVDKKKQERVGDFRNAGRESQPSGAPEQVLVHDFPRDGLGQAIPYGIYDMARNEAWVSVGRDHDSPSRSLPFVNGGARWGAKPTLRSTRCSSPPTPGARTATARVASSTSCSPSPTTRGCASGSATSRSVRASGTRSSIGCSVTSITQNWCGKSLRTFETIGDLIGNTHTATGLRVKAKLDQRSYPTGQKVTAAQMKALSIKRDDFHGDWNYELQPRKDEPEVGDLISI